MEVHRRVPCGQWLRDSAGDETNPRWFAVFVNSRHEKRVSQHFEQRKIEHFLPLCLEVHRWTNRRKAKVEVPLFPNYIFVRTMKTQRPLVLQTPGVLSIVGSMREPTPLADSEIESLCAATVSGRCAQHPYLIEGTRVRVKYGPLAGKEGVLIRKENSIHVVVSLDLIKRSLALTLDEDNVELVCS